MQDFIDDLIKRFKFQLLDDETSINVRKHYKDNLPDEFKSYSKGPLFTNSGFKIANDYNGIVIGDYGAYIVISYDNIITDNVVIKKGEEYRKFNTKFSSKVKYELYTDIKDRHINIYYQKKPVEYADLKPGYFYISPYDLTTRFRKNKYFN